MTLRLLGWNMTPAQPEVCDFSITTINRPVATIFREMTETGQDSPASSPRATARLLFPQKKKARSYSNN